MCARREPMERSVTVTSWDASITKRSGWSENARCSTRLCRGDRPSGSTLEELRPHQSFLCALWAIGARNDHPARAGPAIHGHYGDRSTLFAPVDEVRARRAVELIAVRGVRPRVTSSSGRTYGRGRNTTPRSTLNIIAASAIAIPVTRALRTDPPPPFAAEERYSPWSRSGDSHASTSSEAIVTSQ